ncbi:hypothetical protein SAMN05216436_101261 [bacterium A37T11]|nr:hypothetical protein SAMN05216436_101261 [bacterium A37T11]
MKALEKIFQKNVRALVVIIMAIGLTSSLQAAGLENGPEGGPGKGKKDSVASVVKVPLKSALVRLKTKAGAQVKGVKKPTTTVNRGVLADEGSRYRITAGEPATGHECGEEETLPCTITFDNTVNVPYLDGGNWYVNKGAGITTVGNGPYIAP